MRTSPQFFTRRSRSVASGAGLAIVMLLGIAVPAHSSNDNANIANIADSANDRGNESIDGGVGDAETVTTLPGQLPPTRPVVTASQAPITKDYRGNWVVPLVRAGAPPSLTLNSSSDAVEIDLPIPAGLRPVELRGTFDPRAELAESTVSVKIGIREFSLSSTVRKATPFSFNLDGLRAPAKTATTLNGAFELKTTDLNTECPRIIAEPAQISDLVLVLAGEPMPSKTVAEFLPPILDRVVIDVPEPFDNDVAEGVLRLTSSLVARYADQPVDVVVRSASTSKDLPVEPFTRHFRIVKSQTNTLRLATKTDTVLELAGAGPTFARLADFIGSPAFTTSFSSAVEFTKKFKEPKQTKRSKQFRVTLDQLKRQLSAQGVNRAKVIFTARQSDVGGPGVRMTMRISGRVIAISGPARKATVRLSANGRPLASADVALGDGFTLSGAIEPQVMRRENEIVVESDAVLDSGSLNRNCLPGALIRLELDANSVISNEAGVAVAAGFDRFPQAFHGGFDVSLSPMDVTYLAAASSLLASLQEHAQPVLNPTVVDWPKGAPKVPSLLVGGTSAQVKALSPPLVPGPLIIESDNEGVIGRDKSQPVTALEAFETNAVDQLLLATSSNATDLVKHAASIRTLPGGWTRLTGDVYVLSDGQTKSARLRASTAVPLPSAGDEKVKPTKSPFLGIAVGGSMALGALALWVLGRRLYRRVRRPIR